MLCIVMDQIGMNLIILHTIHCLSPSPAKADTAIRHFAYFIVHDMDVAYISRSNGKTTPIFVTRLRKITVVNPLMCTHFTTVGRIVRKMCLVSSRGETPDQ